MTEHCSIPYSLPPRSAELQVNLRQASPATSTPKVSSLKPPPRKAHGRQAPNVLPTSWPPALAWGRKKTPFGGTLESTPETRPDSSRSSARGARTSVPPPRGISRGHSRGMPPPKATLALPQSSSFQRSSGSRPEALGSPHPASQPGLRAGGRVLWPGVLFTTRNKSAPSGLGWGVAAGSGPIPATPAAPRTRNPGPSPAPAVHCPSQPLPASACASPDPLPSAPLPAHHWPPQAPRTARVPPAPSLHQPSGKLSNLRSSPQLRSRGPRRARGAREGPGRTPTGCLAGSGPEPPGWATASQRSTAQRQVELHDWGGAGGRPGGQTREQRAQRLRAQSGAGAGCAATPRQVSPPEQHCLPRTDLRE